jgi:hypothetical protein
MATILSTEQQLKGFKDSRLLNLLCLFPNKHLITQELSRYGNIPIYGSYSFGINRVIGIEVFLVLDQKKIELFKIKAELCFHDETGRLLDFTIEDFSIQIFVATKIQDNSYDQPEIMGIDELIFYLNSHQNIKAKKQYKLPYLNIWHWPLETFGFKREGLNILSSYFPNHDGKVFDDDYESELKELHAIITNNLAFLLRYQERVMEELELIYNQAYESDLNVFPRFNNSISETASSMYNFWERIAVILNSFYPSKPNAKSPPSLNQYFREIKKVIGNDSRYQNKYLDWFVIHLSNEHKRLGDLRHPMIHFNFDRNPHGLRSADLMKEMWKGIDPQKIQFQWKSEIKFLQQEITELIIGLEYSLELIKCWAVI